MVSEPEKLNIWWTSSCIGAPNEGEIYSMQFGPDYKWKAKVTGIDAPNCIQFLMLEADKDWIDTKIDFRLKTEDDWVSILFEHSGWSEISDHYLMSSYCWAMYLRLIKRYLEAGEVIPYEKRLEV